MSARMWFGQSKKMPADIALALIPSLSRPRLERLVHTLIERMDEADGDPDIEANGDELDGINSEDDFWLFGSDGTPGCIISDPDLGADDEGEPDGDEADGSCIDDWPRGAKSPPVYLSHKWSSQP